ncbi:hypothetical protein [Teredinibacter haidensis]|uniref:hypothetical protein n=1 Tax=Teredinibacter haidensis TaxID=2731755 RepID=UPI000948DD20|nr:hypothetical protein [Teredinibacter haidensis]
MKSKELYGIGIRLVGIYLLVAAITTGIKHGQMGYVYASNGYPDLQSYVTFATIEVMFILVFSVLFIKFPLSIAKLISPRGVESVIEFSGNAKSLIDIFTCLLGIYILSWAIPDVFDNVIYILFNSDTEFLAQSIKDTYVSLYVTLVEIAIGVYLCFWGEGLGKLIYRVRSFRA